MMYLQGLRKSLETNSVARYLTSFILYLNNLSYDASVIKWITSSHKKSYVHTCNTTLARTSNVIDNVHVNNAFS